MRPFTEGIYLKYSKLEHVDAGFDEVQHPIIREAILLLGFENAAARDHDAGGYSGGNRARVVGQLHHRASEGALRPSPTADPSAGAGRAGLPHRDRPSGRADRQAGSVHRRLWRHHLLHLPRRRAASMPSPCEPRMETLFDLEDNLLLFFTGFSRNAGGILKDQDARTQRHDADMIDNLHYVKDLGLSEQGRARERRYLAVRPADARALGAQEAPLARHEQPSHRRVVSSSASPMAPSAGSSSARAAADF